MGRSLPHLQVRLPQFDVSAARHPSDVVEEYDALGVRVRLVAARKRAVVVELDMERVLNGWDVLNKKPLFLNGTDCSHGHHPTRMWLAYHPGSPNFLVVRSQTKNQT